MPRLFHPLLKMIAHATHRELAAQVQYLKVENEILRSKLPKRITVTPAEKAHLVKFGKKVDGAIRELITIVTPRTFARWVSGGTNKPSATKRKPGRPQTPEKIREIILRIAEETGCGYTRILGKRKKLGIHSVGRTTVRKILIEAGHLDHFVVLGAKRLNHIVSEYITHYHEERPHQNLGNAPPMKRPPPNLQGDVACRERLGGLLRHYYRQAAGTKNALN